MIIFNNPAVQTIAKAVVAKHGGNTIFLSVPSTGIILTGCMSPELIASFESIAKECEAKAAAIRDVLAVCQLAKAMGSETIEVNA